jgi:hypothetical protein
MQCRLYQVLVLLQLQQVLLPLGRQQVQLPLAQLLLAFQPVQLQSLRLLLLALHLLHMYC